MTASSGLTATQLKYFAAVFMVIEHIGKIFTPMAPFFPADSLWFYAVRYLGRLAFPIFAYFAAQGCRLTSDYRRYLLRLGLFGAVTHAVAYGATGGNSPGHIKSMLVGNHCVLPVQGGKVVLGHAQDIYFAEFDGIKNRKYYIEIMGE